MALRLRCWDYQSQQQKLMPMLATCFALHFAKNFLVDQFCAMKRTKDELLVQDVHSLSAGASPTLMPRVVVWLSSGAQPGAPGRAAGSL